MGLRMQPRNEKFFTLFSKAGSNVVESAAILMEFAAAPHERWAEFANACTTPSTPATTPLKASSPGLHSRGLQSPAASLHDQADHPDGRASQRYREQRR